MLSEFPNQAWTLLLYNMLIFGSYSENINSLFCLIFFSYGQVGPKKDREMWFLSWFYNKIFKFKTSWLHLDLTYFLIDFSCQANRGGGGYWRERNYFIPVAYHTPQQNYTWSMIWGDKTNIKIVCSAQVNHQLEGNFICKYKACFQRETNSECCYSSTEQ